MAREELLPLPPSQKIPALALLYLTLTESGCLLQNGAHYTQQIVISRNIFPSFQENSQTNTLFGELFVMCLCAFLTCVYTQGHGRVKETMHFFSRALAQTGKCIFWNSLGIHLESGGLYTVLWGDKGQEEGFGCVCNEVGDARHIRTRRRILHSSSSRKSFKRTPRPRGWVGLKSINLRPANIVFKARIFNIFWGVTNCLTLFLPCPWKRTQPPPYTSSPCWLPETNLTPRGSSLRELLFWHASEKSFWKEKEKRWLKHWKKTLMEKKSLSWGWKILSSKRSLLVVAACLEKPERRRPIFVPEFTAPKKRALLMSVHTNVRPVPGDVNHSFWSPAVDVFQLTSTTEARFCPSVTTLKRRVRQTKIGGIRIFPPDPETFSALLSNPSKRRPSRNSLLWKSRIWNLFHFRNPVSLWQQAISSSSSSERARPWNYCQREATKCWLLVATFTAGGRTRGDQQRPDEKKTKRTRNVLLDGDKRMLPSIGRFFLPKFPPIPVWIYAFFQTSSNPSTSLRWP